MPLKHGCAAPTGITITGGLLKKVTKKEEIVGFESMDEAGVFEAGKILRMKVTLQVSGELLETNTLPTKGTGAATAASPFIDDVTVNDENETQSTFELTAHYFEAPPVSHDY